MTNKLTQSTPKRLVGVSTKMYFSMHKTQAYVNELLTQLENQETPSNVDIFFIPDFVSLQWTADKVREGSASPASTLLLLGAQNCFYEDAGAYTGEISPKMLAELGCTFVEIGHAERRRIFHETDEITARKAEAVVRNGMVPLVCIGEKSRDEISVAIDECRMQVQAVLAAIPDGADVVLAYEPVWAIGQSEPAGAEHIVGVTRELRKMGHARQGSLRILYGGSAGPGLFEKLKDSVDGLFLGRFAHSVDRFLETIGEVSQP